MEKVHKSAATYRIGAVAKLTGVSPDAIRIWERRYSVVEPIRTEKGSRLYTDAHVNRLRLLKELVDRGQAIGSIAGLSETELQRRLLQSENGLTEAALQRASGPVKVVLVGPTLCLRVDHESAFSPDILIAGRYADINEFAGTANGAQSGATLLLEIPYLEDGVLQQALDLVDAGRCCRVVLIYNFANWDSLRRVDNRRVHIVRAPYTLQGLWERLLEIGLEQHRREDTGVVEPRYAIAKPMFDQSQLLSIASQSRSIRCECPRHLVDLIQSLTAFEDYSRYCEVRNKEDEELHRMLCEQTGKARQLIEKSLMTLVQQEGLSVEPRQSLA